MGLKAFQYLSNFPPEIWASIIVCLSGEQLGRLKMTGSKLAWLRLCSKNVVKSVNLGFGYMIFKRWPAFLNEFKYIEELVIHNLNKDWCHSWQPRLDSVPKTLRKLTIKLKGEYSPLFFTCADGSALSLSECVPKLEYLEAMVDWNDKIAALSHTPQKLKSLIVLDYDGSIPLPASLTALKCSGIYLKGPIQVPNQLESIETECLFGMEHLVNHLPCCLQTLNFKWPYSVSPGFDLIPKTCTALGLLDFSESDIDDTVLESDPASLIPLPETLRSLDSVQVPPLCWPHLPSRLETLILQEVNPWDAILPVTIKNPMNGVSYTTSTYPIQHLPKSLTSLHVKTTRRPHDYPQPLAFEVCPEPISLTNPSLLWPPKLVCLSVVNIPLSVGAAQQLPPTLTSIEMSHVDHHISQHLPRGLTTLTIYDVLMSAELVKGLPTSLVRLKMIHAVSWKNHFDPVTCEILPLEVIRQRCSTVYEEYENQLWLGDASLPTSLTSLTMNNFDYLGELFVRQNLPNLTFLDLENSWDFPDSSIAYLPQHLTYLNLSESKLVTGKCFPNLPKDLGYLNLNSSVEIYDDDIKCLPPALESLQISFARHLTNACIKDLPRGLSSLHLFHNLNIAPEVFPMLPYKIRSIHHTDSFNAAQFTVSNGTMKIRGLSYRILGFAHREGSTLNVPKEQI